ncbi:hypothetical protein [Streptomyces sp. NPDC059994]|uniref:hypothetical protein n=1 Tax=Streptomyces sp. NPDC059994 TaxID=3347029 RepID=UPI0036B78711
MTETPASERTTAETLKAAAQKLRRLAFQADSGPWETTWRDQQYHLDGYRDGELHPISEWTYAIATWEPQASEQRAECDTANADYIATMHPGVGTALARLLERTAIEVTEAGGFAAGAADGPMDHSNHNSWSAALAVARQILGEAA